MTMHTPAQKAALLALVVLIAGLAVTAVAQEALREPPPAAPTVEDHNAPMTPEEQCAHMPEHCAGGGAGGT